MVGSAVCLLWRSLRPYEAIFLWVRSHFVCQANAVQQRLGLLQVLRVKAFIATPLKHGARISPVRSAHGWGRGCQLIRLMTSRWVSTSRFRPPSRARMITSDTGS